MAGEGPARSFLERNDNLNPQEEVEVMDLGEGDCMQCVSCKRKFDEFSFMNIMFLEKCTHIVCRLCFKSIVRKVFAKGQTMCCPQC